MIEKFKKERREGNTCRGGIRSPASVNREIELLSRILTMAVDHGLIEMNPCRKVRKLRLDNRGELFNLTWEKVDFARSLIYVTNTKSGKDRVVPMNQTVRDELMTMKERTKSDLVFVSYRSGINLTGIRKGFIAACREAGIKNFRFHDLRHTAGTRLADAGADTFTIKEILGHGSIQTSAIYVHATDQGKRRAVEALALYSSQKVCLKFVANQERRSK